MLKALTAQWAATFFVGGVSFLVTIFIARNLGPQAFGMYSSSLAAGAMVGILLDGGMRNLVLRERTRTSPHLLAIALDLPSYAMGHALYTSGVLIIIALLLFQDDSLRLALATVACFLSLSLNQVTSSFKRGDGTLIADFRFQVGARASSAVLIVLCVALGYKAPWQILTAWAFAGFAYLALYRSYWQPPRFLGLSKIYCEALPYTVLDLAITVYIRSSLILLNLYAISPELIGQFAASFRICEAVIMFVSPLGLLVFRHFRTTNFVMENLRKQLSVQLRVAIPISIAVAVLVWAFSNQIIELFYGFEYHESADILKILALMLVFVLPNTILSQAAIALDKHLVVMCAAVLAAIVNLSFNLIMIPAYGIRATAWASVLAEVLMFALIAGFLFQQGRRNISS
jgi:O-antigen/teichoic acid export membrane protein